MNNINESYKKIIDYYDSVNQDVYIYVGSVDSKIQLLRDIIRCHSNKKEEVCLFLATYGGDPDWAYRLVTTLRKHYTKFHIVIPGYCKSAGTLIALGADTLKFHEYGELGPLDVQMKRKDNLLGYNSGLDVFQAISVINTSAHECFHKMFIEFLLKGGGSIPTETAATIAKDLSVGIYASLASQIDPLELGEKNRAMKIASSYGEKLDFLSKNHNMKQGSLTKLISDYPSHGFVIDMPQAKELFNNVEEMSKMDYNLYEIFKEKFQNPNEAFYFDLESMRSCITEQEKNDATNSGDRTVSLSVSENKSSRRKPKPTKQ